MEKNVTMKAPDCVSAKLAEAFITIKGNRYNFMQLKDFEAKIEKDKAEVPILGRVMKGNKAVGMSGKFSATAYYNQSIFRQALLEYKESGLDAYFEIQVTNDDPQSKAGRQTVVFIDCNTDGGILSKFDADGEYLEEEIEGTFEDFKMPEAFKLLDGMF